MGSARFRLLTGGREIEVPGDGLLVGRASDCQLRLEDGLVSRHHARFCATGEGLTVEDLKSRNGVQVNQSLIRRRTRLSHGDRVGIGLKMFEVIDRALLNRPPTLSTLPPTSHPFSSPDTSTLQQDTAVAHLDDLSPREREVLELIVFGHTQKEMAEQLHLSVKTVESHRARIAEKLGCHTRAELVTYAISAGILRGMPSSNPTR